MCGHGGPWRRRGPTCRHGVPLLRRAPAPPTGGSPAPLINQWWRRRRPSSSSESSRGAPPCPPLVEVTAEPSPRGSAATISISRRRLAMLSCGCSKYEYASSTYTPACL